jgi:hypothetical protein
VIVRDARGSLVHVRRRDDGECVGCIEAGLYEIVRALILVEAGGDQKREAAVTVVTRGSLGRSAAVTPRTDRIPASSESVFRTRYEDRPE